MTAWDHDNDSDASPSKKPPEKHGPFLPFLGVVRAVTPFDCGSVARSRIKHLQKKLRSENVGIGASSEKMGKWMEMPCFQEIRALSLVVWILMNYSGVRYLLAISPKTGLVKDDHSPDAWKSGFVEAEQAEEERQRQVTQARQDAEAKVELILHLGISGTMLNIFLTCFWIMSYVWCNWVHGQTLLQTLKI